MALLKCVKQSLQYSSEMPFLSIAKYICIRYHAYLAKQTLYVAIIMLMYGVCYFEKN